MWVRKYYLKFFKITSPTNDFFIGGFYNISLSKHFENIKKKYLEWVVDDTCFVNKGKKKYYMPIFSFFQEFGVDCKIELIYQDIGSIKNIKNIIDYIVEGLKNYKKCYNLKILN
jgi:hypothetical protein